MTSRIVMLLMAGALFVPSAYGQTRVAAPAAAPVAAPTDPGKPVRDPDPPPPATQDPTWRRLHKLIGTSTGASDHPEARAQLTKALNEPRNQGGATVLPARCNAQVGCIADVMYDDPTAFTKFDEGRFGPGTTIHQWDGINGRTGLLRRPDRKLIATWYFFIRKAPKQKRGV